MEQGILLLRLGCQIAQGFCIARPMPAADLPAWVASWTPDPQWSNVKFIPHATTYLNQRRWEDDWSATGSQLGLSALPRETNGEAINASSMRRLGIAP